MNTATLFDTLLGCAIVAVDEGAGKGQRTMTPEQFYQLALADEREARRALKMVLREPPSVGQMIREVLAQGQLRAANRAVERTRRQVVASWEWAA